MFLKIKTNIIILLVLISFFLTSLVVNADIKKVNKDNVSPMGSFKINIPNNNVKLNREKYIPINKVAETVGYQLEWRLENGNIKGNMANIQFSTDNFIIAYGNLFLPIDIFIELFNLNIEINGNNYIIYSIGNFNYDIDFIIQADKKEFSRNEPIAISALLFNHSNRSVDIRYSSGKRYDLILERYNKEKWRLSEDTFSTQSLRWESIMSNEYKLYTNLISPSEDTYLYSGIYTLYAEISTAYGNTIRSNAIEIRLR